MRTRINRGLIRLASMPILRRERRLPTIGSARFQNLKSTEKKGGWYKLPGCRPNPTGLEQRFSATPYLLREKSSPYVSSGSERSHKVRMANRKLVARALCWNTAVVQHLLGFPPGLPALTLGKYSGRVKPFVDCSVWSSIARFNTLAIFASSETSKPAVPKMIQAQSGRQDTQIDA